MAEREQIIAQIVNKIPHQARKRIGIIFSNNENWIGGTYYITNLIQALDTLEDTKKPEIVIFSDNPKDAEIIQNTKYPYLDFLKLSLEYNIFERIINKLSRILLKKNIINKKYAKNCVEAVFPYDLQVSLENINHKIAWIPDFQEYFLKDFFSEEVLEIRKKHHLKIIAQDIPVILSSKEAENNFRQIYPQAKNKTSVLNFAVTHPAYKDLNINDLREKFKITKPYFISPNQFWVHKNHQVILDAIKLLKENNLSIDFQIIFTGKEFDFRYPEYANNLKKFVLENNLSDHISFFGFIDRKEQLQLMNNALAVIQPSLFEGWSTVVEDAKAMNKFLILSDITVHKEQMQQQIQENKQENVCFFDPKSAIELKKAIIQTLNNVLNHTSKKENNTEYNVDYKKDITTFANKFIEYI